jgi:hypothetical protein
MCAMDRTLLWIKDEDTAGLSPDQKRAVAGAATDRV